MAAKPVALLVGVTGMLGGKIARAVLDKGAMSLRALVRPGTAADPRKGASLARLAERGATFVEGDLADPDSLLAAARGAEVIISAVNNEPELIIDGQARLLEAGERAGVRRFIPSDFSLDYRKLDFGDNHNLDMRKRFLPLMVQSRLSYVSVLNGAFMEMPLTPFIGTINLDEGTFNYWGEGDEPLDYTTTDDTARYVAEAAADEELANTFLEVAGETITFRRMKEVFEETTGRALRENRRGGVAELREFIERKKETARSPWEYLPLQYEWAMVSGRGKLDNVINGRYPHVEPTGFRDFFRRAAVAAEKA